VLGRFLKALHDPIETVRHFLVLSRHCFSMNVVTILKPAINGV